MASPHKIPILIVVLSIFFQIMGAMDVVRADLINPSVLTSHAPILIEGDSQFNNSNGVVRGSGTTIDPYIIENWSIDATTKTGISISNTNASFIIQNCEIFNGSNQSGSNAGLRLYNVLDGIITNLSIHDCRQAFIISYCNRSTLSNCTFYNLKSANYGWYLNDFKIVRNTFSDCDFDYCSAFDIGYSRNVSLIENRINETRGIDIHHNYGKVNLTDNVIQNSLNGIRFDFTPGGTIQNNTINDCRYPFNLQPSLTTDYEKFNISPNNTINNRPIRFLVNESDQVILSNCSFLGMVNCINVTAEDMTPDTNCSAIVLINTSEIYLDNITLRDQRISVHSSNNNYITNCNINGSIYVLNSNNNTIHGNDICGTINSEYGIYIDSCDDMTVTNNTINSVKESGISCSGNRTTLNNNTIKKSKKAGIVITGGDHKINGNEISENENNGIIYGKTTRLVIANSSIYGHSRAAIYPIHELETEMNYNLTITNCRIHNNSMLSGSFGGISLINGPMGRISNNTMQDLDDGLLLTGYCDGLQVFNNSFTNCSDTIVLQTSGVRIHNNTINKSFYGIKQDGTSTGNLIENNTISHAGCYGIFITGVNQTIKGNIIKDGDGAYSGVYVRQGGWANISYNEIFNIQQYGIWDAGIHAKSCNIFSNNIYACQKNGIELEGSSHGVSNNTIHDCGLAGIDMNGADNSKISGNNVYNNKHGIYLTNAGNNNISSNYFINNSAYGIELFQNYYMNLVYNNYFNNTNNYKPSGATVWNISKMAGDNIIDGANLGGNYWSDYSGQDVDDDGIGDTKLPYGPGDWLPLIGDMKPPTITDRTTGIPTTGDPFQLEARINDNRAVDMAFLEYWFDNMPHNVTNASFSSGTIKEGNYIVNITIPTNAKKLGFRWKANDTRNNQNSSLIRNLTVMDNDPPEVTDLSGNPYTNATFRFSVDARDNIGINKVTVEYRFNGGQPVSNSISSPGPYQCSILIPLGARKLSYIITGFDFAGNKNTLPVIDKLVTDDIPPAIQDLSGSPKTGESYLIECAISDNILVSGAMVKYRFDSGTNACSEMALSGTYKIQIDVPSQSRMLHYIIEARDGANNTMYFFADRQVIDTISPVIADHSGNATTGDIFVFRFTVADNHDLDRIILEYSIDSGSIARVNYAGDFCVTVPRDGMKLIYHVTATDLSGNIALWTSNATITDNDPPEIIGIPPTPLHGRIYAPGLQFSDNIGVRWANLTYSFDNGPNKTVQYTSTCALSEPVKGMLLFLHLFVMDNSGIICEKNWTLMIIDPEIPRIGDESGCPLTGQKFNIELNITGNRGPFSIEVRYWADNASPVVVTDQSRIEIQIPEDAKILHYSVRVCDAEGKKNETNFTRPVKDIILPEIRDLTEGPALRNTRMRVVAEILENIQVKNVTLEYWTNGPIQRIQMTQNVSRYIAEIQILDGTRLNYRISCSDISGNIAVTGTRTFPIIENKTPNQSSILLSGMMIAIMIGVLLGISLLIVRRKKSR